MAETYDPRIVGPKATKTPHGRKFVFKQLIKCIDDRQLHGNDRLSAAYAQMTSGKDLSDTTLAEIEALWLSFVCVKRLPSVIAFGQRAP